MSGAWSFALGVSIIPLAIVATFAPYWQGAGCQVTWSKIAKPDRIVFAVQRGKRDAIVLSLSSTTKVKEWDLAA